MRRPGEPDAEPTNGEAPPPLGPLTGAGKGAVVPSGPTGPSPNGADASDTWAYRSTLSGTPILARRDSLTPQRTAIARAKPSRPRLIPQVIGETRDMTRNRRGETSCVDLGAAYSTKGVAQINSKEN